MPRFLSGLWSAVSAPFRMVLWLVIQPLRLVFWLAALPFRWLRRLHRFLTVEPEENPLLEVITGAAQDPSLRQSLWDHIEALRKHLLRAMLALAFTVAVAFSFSRLLAVILARPLGDTALLGAIEVTESVGVFMRIALMAGIALAVPYIAFEMWLFAAPGLKPRERIYGLIGIPSAAILFAGGVLFTYFILPTAINALQSFNNYMGFETNWRPHSYYTFVTGLMFWIGVSFEFPLVIYVLTAIGLVKPRVLKDQWRLAVVLIAVLAAAITPTVDPVNMGIVMVPMILLYFLSIGLSYLAYAGRRNSAKRKGTP